MRDLRKMEREHTQWVRETAEKVLTKEQLLCAEKTDYPVCHLTGQCQFIMAPKESEAFEDCMKAHGQDFFGKPIGNNSNINQNNKTMIRKGTAEQQLLALVLSLVTIFAIVYLVSRAWSTGQKAA